MKKIDEIIRSLIAENKTEEAFEFLQKHRPGNSFENEIALLANQFAIFDKKRLAGVFSEQEATIERTRIQSALLEIGEKIRKEEENRLRRSAERDRGKLLGVVCLFVFNVALILNNPWINPWKDRRQIEQAAELVHQNRWITYQPSDYDPESNPAGFLDSATVERELNAIQKAGFSGIITFDCYPKMNLLYRIAHRKGLRIIAGIWNLHDEKEINNAHKIRKLVNGYCIGHDKLYDFPVLNSTEYDFARLARTIAIFRRRTAKPVSTTQYGMDYYKKEDLLDVSDWIFPDVHVTIEPESRISAMECEVNPKYHAQETLRWADTIADLNSGGKAILLKMVSYPAKGLRCASDTTQWEYFMNLLPDQGDIERPLPDNVSVAIHSTFDPIWKKWNLVYNAWDPYTGIFNKDGTSRMTARKIIGKRLKWR